jgi:hypothetical protein
VQEVVAVMEPTILRVVLAEVEQVEAVQHQEQ